jgi:hypothetical protein
MTQHPQLLLLPLVGVEAGAGVLVVVLSATQRPCAGLRKTHAGPRGLIYAICSFRCVVGHAWKGCWLWWLCWPSWLGS